MMIVGGFEKSGEMVRLWTNINVGGRTARAGKLKNFWHLKRRAGGRKTSSRRAGAKEKKSADAWRDLGRRDRRCL